MLGGGLSVDRQLQRTIGYVNSPPLIWPAPELLAAFWLKLLTQRTRWQPSIAHFNIGRAGGQAGGALVAGGGQHYGGGAGVHHRPGRLCHLRRLRLAGGVPGAATFSDSLSSAEAARNCCVLSQMLWDCCAKVARNHVT
jgi:hypothetical protein